jgi:hypothetical protein
MAPGAAPGSGLGAPGLEVANLALGILIVEPIAGLKLADQDFKRIIGSAFRRRRGVHSQGATVLRVMNWHAVNGRVGVTLLCRRRISSWPSNIVAQGRNACGSPP